MMILLIFAAKSSAGVGIVKLEEVCGPRLILL